MFGSGLVEVALGLIFVYLVLSLVCTAINERIATFINKRGRNLFDGIRNLLNDPKFTGLAQEVYNHGLIDGISKDAVHPGKPNRPPSYIPAESFSMALVDILGAHGVVAATYGELISAVEAADDAYDAAVRATEPARRQWNRIGRAAQDLQSRIEGSAQAVAEAKAAAEQAWSDLLAAEEQARAEYEQADTAAKAAPGDPSLAAALSSARLALDKAGAAVKQLTARRYAKESARDPKDPVAARNVSTSLDEALLTGRKLYSEIPDKLDSIQTAVNHLPDGHTKESLLVLLDKTRQEVATGANEVAALRENIESWFNNSMDRIGGWYKRWTQQVLLVLAFVTVFVSNADTVMIAQRLTVDSALREGLVGAAQSIAALPVATPAATVTPSAGGAAPVPTATPAAVVDERSVRTLEQARALELPLGWSRNPDDPRAFFPKEHSRLGWAATKLFGLGISVFAVSLGAPFWFDTLSKVVNMRGSGTPPGETKKGA